MSDWTRYARKQTLNCDRNGYRIEADIRLLYRDKYATHVAIQHRGVSYVVRFESTLEHAKKVVDSVVAYADDCRVIPAISYDPYSVRYIPRAFPGADLHVEILVDAPDRNNSRVSAFTAVSPPALINDFEVLNEVENFAVLLFRIVGEICEYAHIGIELDQISSCRTRPRSGGETPSDNEGHAMKLEGRIETFEWTDGPELSILRVRANGHDYAAEVSHPEESKYLWYTYRDGAWQTGERIPDRDDAKRCAETALILLIEADRNEGEAK